MGIANSPSPVKRMKNKLGLYETFDISPERCSRSRSPTKFSPEKLSPCREKADGIDNSPALFNVRRTSTLMKRKSIHLDAVPQMTEKKKKSFSINEGKLNVTTKSKLSTSLKKSTTIKAVSNVKAKNVASLAMSTAARRGGVRINLNQDN